MKNYKLIIGIFFLLISSIVSAQQEDLNSYLKIAAENNPELKAKFNDYMAALEVAPQVKALPDPQIAFAYFISPVETRVGPQRFKISASQMFPWFGTLKAKENVAVQAAKAKYEIFEETKSLLFNDVKAAYYNLYFNKKAMAITLENMGILETFQKLAEIKIEAGLVSMVDEYRLEMEINELENQLALLKDKERFLETAFNNLLDVESSIPVEVPEDLWTNDFPLSKQAALDSIAQFNHQLLNIDLQQAALAYKREVAENMGKPNFKLGFDYTFIGKGENNLSGKDAFIFPTVGITIPLYQNKYKAMIQEVVYLEAAKTDEKANKTNLLETLFEKGWNDYLDANRRIELYKTQSTLAQKSMNLLETEYITGNKNFEEILRMERKVLKYNLEEEKAKADKQAAISFITYLMGK
ncbi:MAG: TolC family protein [Bacteroidetes bacterium]|nr:TolC family protein [Bacteroidota bacterium]